MQQSDSAAECEKKKKKNKTEIATGDRSCTWWAGGCTIWYGAPGVDSGERLHATASTVAGVALTRSTTQLKIS